MTLKGTLIPGAELGGFLSLSGACGVMGVLERFMKVI